jgi:hypothetical protein
MPVSDKTVDDRLSQHKTMDDGFVTLMIRFLRYLFLNPLRREDEQGSAGFRPLRMVSFLPIWTSFAPPRWSESVIGGELMAIAFFGLVSHFLSDAPKLVTLLHNCSFGNSPAQCPPPTRQDDLCLICVCPDN